MLQMHANHREDLEEVYAGDIAAAVGLKDSFTGDTLMDPEHPVVLESMTVPGAGDRGSASSPRRRPTRTSSASLSSAWPKRTRPSASRRTAETMETLIAGMGELHLDVLVDRMMREFKVAANIGKPQVSYRETVRREARATGASSARPAARASTATPSSSSSPSRRAAVMSSSTRSSAAHPARVHQARRQGIKRGTRAGHLRGCPWSMCKRDALRRLVPRRRLVGDGVQDRRLAGHQGGRPEGRPDHPRADHEAPR